MKKTITTLALSAVASTALIAAILSSETAKQDISPLVSQNTPEVQITVIEEPVKPKEEASLNLDNLPAIENARMTYYCVCKKCCGKEPDHPAYGITASGREAEPYKSVAVDPFLITLGSTVYVDYGDGVIHEYRADDTGSGVHGAHLDLCVSEHEEALDLGVKTVKVWWQE